MKTRNTNPKPVYNPQNNRDYFQDMSEFWAKTHNDDPSRAITRRNTNSQGDLT